MEVRPILRVALRIGQQHPHRRDNRRTLLRRFGRAHKLFFFAHLDQPNSEFWHTDTRGVSGRRYPRAIERLVQPLSFLEQYGLPREQLRPDQYHRILSQLEQRRSFAQSGPGQDRKRCGSRDISDALRHSRNDTALLHLSLGRHLHGYDYRDSRLALRAYRSLAKEDRLLSLSLGLRKVGRKLEGSRAWTTKRWNRAAACAK